MAAALGAVLVVIALWGLASAAPLRPQPRSDAAAGRLYKPDGLYQPDALYKPDALENEINDLILPLLSPRRKTAADKSKLQLSDLLADPLKRRNKPFVKLAPIGKPGEGLNRDKNPVAIWVADIPRTSTAQRDDDDQTDSATEEDDDNVSHDTDDEEHEEYSAEEAREADDHPENLEKALDTDNKEDRPLVRNELELESTNELEQSHVKNALHENVHREAKDSTLDESRDPKLDETRDPTLDESLSSLQLLSHDIASALRAEQTTESAVVPHSTEKNNRDTVLECIERKVTVPELQSVEEQVREAPERSIPADYWRHFRAEGRPGYIGSGWMHDYSHRIDPQKSYHLSFSFTK